MQLRDVNYYSDVLISIDIYAQRHSKRALGWGRGRTKCILIYHLSPHSIIKGWPSQVGGPYTWWGGEGGASAPMPHPMPYPSPLQYIKQHTCHGLLRWALLYPALPSASYITLSQMDSTSQSKPEGHEGNNHIHYALSTDIGLISNYTHLVLMVDVCTPIHQQLHTFVTPT